MGNLGVKLARLPPDLLQEVEDYVDYLLEHRGPPAHESSTGTDSPGVSSKGPIILAQEAPVPRKETDPHGILDWID